MKRTNKSGLIVLTVIIALAAAPISLELLPKVFDKTSEAERIAKEACKESEYSGCVERMTNKINELYAEDAAKANQENSKNILIITY